MEAHKQGLAGREASAEGVRKLFVLPPTTCKGMKYKHIQFCSCVEGWWKRAEGFTVIIYDASNAPTGFPRDVLGFSSGFQSSLNQYISII